MSCSYKEVLNIDMDPFLYVTQSSGTVLDKEFKATLIHLWPTIVYKKADKIESVTHS